MPEKVVKVKSLASRVITYGDWNIASWITIPLQVFQSVILTIRITCEMDWTYTFL